MSNVITEKAKKYEASNSHATIISAFRTGYAEAEKDLYLKYESELNSLRDELDRLSNFDEKISGFMKVG